MSTNDNTDSTGNPDSPETAAADVVAMDQLERQAQQLEHGATNSQAQAEEKQAQHIAKTAAAELLAVLQLCRVIVSPAFAWWSDFAATWSDPQLVAISQAGADVMVKHGLTMGELMSTWGPYIALIGATVPPSLVTFHAIKQRNAAPPREPLQ